MKAIEEYIKILKEAELVVEMGGKNIGWVDLYTSNEYDDTDNTEHVVLCHIEEPTLKMALAKACKVYAKSIKK